MIYIAAATIISALISVIFGYYAIMIGFGLTIVNFWGMLFSFVLCLVFNIITRMLAAKLKQCTVGEDGSHVSLKH